MKTLNKRTVSARPAWGGFPSPDQLAKQTMPKKILGVSATYGLDKRNPLMIFVRDQATRTGKGIHHIYSSLPADIRAQYPDSGSIIKAARPGIGKTAPADLDAALRAAFAALPDAHRGPDITP